MKRYGRRKTDDEQTESVSARTCEYGGYDIDNRQGVTDNVLKQADDAVEAREIIKLKCLETAMMTPREAAEEIAAAINAEVVQVIGSKAVIYRPAKKPKIVLPK